VSSLHTIKNIISYSLFFLFISHISIANAAPISRAKMAKIIKHEIITRNSTNDIELAGFKLYTNIGGVLGCDERIVNSVKILQIGVVHKSWFRVKFKIKGSCKLTNPIKVDFRTWYELERETGSRSLRVTKMIDGRVPYRDIPLEIVLGRDDFGNWGVQNGWGSREHLVISNPERDGPDTKSSLAYREKLYLKLGKGLQRDYNFKITTPQSRRGGGTPLQRKSKTHKKVRAEKTYHPKNALYNRLHGMVAPWNGEGMAFYEMDDYFRKHLDIYKIFDSLPLKKQYGLVQRVAESKNHQHYTGKILKDPGTRHRHKIILQISEELRQSKGSNQSSTPRNRKLKNSKGNSSRHSHAGRFHIHALPRQGKAHRHGNGAIGR